MELSLNGAWIGASRDQVFIRPTKGETITLDLRTAEALMLGLRDAIQTADHLHFADDNAHVEQPVKIGGVFEALENLIEVADGTRAA